MKRIIFVTIGVLVSVAAGYSQPASEADSLASNATLGNCVRYALAHQPVLKQSALDEEIVDHSISRRLADWFPQLVFNANVAHSPELPTSIVQGTAVRVGLANNSNGQFALTQNIFNRDVLLASSSAGAARTLARQITVSNQIDVVLRVSKAYYASLATRQQIGSFDESITRLERTLKDAYSQYQAGVVDKTDYKRATIALNNVRAQRSHALNQLKARYESLKEQMGYPPEAGLALVADSTEMEREAVIDTAQSVVLENRIEYQALQSRRQLQQANLTYSWLGFLPAVSAYGSYTLNYQSSDMPTLYRHNYPYSSVGLQLSFPIFESGKRVQEIKQAGLELDRVDYDIEAFRNAAGTQYAQAMADYKSSFNTYVVLKENVELAKEVYRTILVQYKAGTKTYLELIVAETDLRSAQDNLIDALYQVLTSKLDLEKALGSVSY